jgi:hypothetical protein
MCACQSFACSFNSIPNFYSHQIISITISSSETWDVCAAKCDQSDKEKSKYIYEYWDVGILYFDRFYDVAKFATPIIITDFVYSYFQLLTWKYLLYLLCLF